MRGKSDLAANAWFFAGADGFGSIVLYRAKRLLQISFCLLRAAKYCEPEGVRHAALITRSTDRRIHGQRPHAWICRGEYLDKGIGARAIRSIKNCHVMRTATEIAIDLPVQGIGFE